MIIHEGPLKKVSFKEQITVRLNKSKGFFLFLSLGLPILLFLPFKFDLIPSSVSSGNAIEATALVTIPNIGTGSAFLVSPTKLITARHVIESLNENDLVSIEFVKSNGKTKSEAKILFKPNDEGNDYAVLELVKPINDIYPLNIGDAGNIQINDEVTIIGYPNGLFSCAKAQVTNNELSENPLLFQMNGGAWSGNSGGPVLDKYSEDVIGILITGFEGKFKGLVYAIKINALLQDPQFISRKIDFRN
jgi:S1-C subfamily serine protease